MLIKLNDRIAGMIVKKSDFLSLFAFTLLLLTVLCVSSSIADDCPTGDLTSDCMVSMDDLLVFASQWMNPPICSGIGCGDLVGSDGVNWLDFAVLSNSWLKQGYPLVINEYMSENDDVIEDPDQPSNDKQTPDWIELYNYSSATIDIAGLYLTDNGTEFWQIPGGYPDKTTIGPGSYLIIWADGETDQGPLHVGFKLTSSGNETVSLLRPDMTTVIDSLVTRSLDSNQSWGRQTDGSDQWQLFVLGDDLENSPTPGGPNGSIPPEDYIVINEIMYNPNDPDNPDKEDIGQEYIELYNRGNTAVNLSGWQITSGVDFTFPDISIDRKDYLVIPADIEKFIVKYPYVTNVINDRWTGRLSDSGEKIELVTNKGRQIDVVEYADQGDWAKRYLGPSDRGQRGWMWSDAHDGLGESLELANPEVSNEFGRNWKSGNTGKGTPGAANSVLSTDVIPIVYDVSHSPLIPGSSDQVTVSVRVFNESGSDITVKLHWRKDQSTYSQNVYPDYNPASYAVVDMNPDPSGYYSGVIPPQSDGSVIEFFVSVNDGVHTVYYPEPCNVDGVDKQVANLLLQVDDSFVADETWIPGSQPRYYMIMTNQEKERLRDIGDSSDGEEDSDAMMNATFISIDGTSSICRYNVGVRNRGHGSRTGPPNNYRVNFVHDNTWKQSKSINLNCRYTHIQLAGNTLFQMAGIAAPDVLAVKVFLNGLDMAEGRSNMYGSYVHIESIDSDMSEKHWPDDPNGNVYKCMRITVPSANMTYLGDSEDPYRVNYFKQTNERVDDWNDLINMTYAFSSYITDSQLIENAELVADTDQWLRFLALMSFLDNNETSIATGYGDDYYLYAGIIDPRFILVPHDLDTILGHSSYVDSGIFDFLNDDPARQFPSLNRMFKEPKYVSSYYRHLHDIANNLFDTDEFNDYIDRLLGYVPASTVNSIKNFVAGRKSHLEGLIPYDFDISAPTQVSGYGYSSNGAIVLTGNSNALNTQSVKVNGASAEWDPISGGWNYGSSQKVEVIPAGSTWKYLDDGSDQGVIADGSGWFGNPDYDDSSWHAESPAELGYGDGDEETVVDYGPDSGNKYTTTYFRKKFTIEDASVYDSLMLRIKRDDGAAVYLNGSLVLRDNIDNDVADADIDYLTAAQSSISGSEESWPPANEYHYVNAGLLVNGENTIAVSIHQYEGNSSDISFDLELTGLLTAQGAGFLNPGINRVVVEAFEGEDGQGAVSNRGYIDIWYDKPSAGITVNSNITTDTTFTAGQGPWIIDGTVEVDNAAVLTIEPGTTLFFNDSASLVIRNQSRLVADGTKYKRIIFTRHPQSLGTWNGIQFVDCQSDNSISYAVFEYGRTNDGTIGFTNSKIVIDNVFFDKTDRRKIRSANSSAVIRNSVFTDMFGPGEAPTGDNVCEQINGSGIPSGGYFIIENNLIGSTKGHNDVIDFSSPIRSASGGAVLQVLNNVFAGGGDELIDLGGDAHIEGNIFAHVHKDQYNTGTGESNAISTGDNLSGQNDSVVSIVRNIFYDVDHAVNLKKNTYMFFENNIVSGIPADYYDEINAVTLRFSAINLLIPDRDPPGMGAYLADNIFHDIPIRIFDHIDEDISGNPAPMSTDLVMDNCIVPEDLALNQVAMRGIVIMDLGSGNIAADPMFKDVPEEDFTLKQGSPAISSGRWGTDMGPGVSKGAVIALGPAEITGKSEAGFEIGGASISHYKYRLDGGSWSSEILVTEPLVLTGLSDGPHELKIVGLNFAGVWQDEQDAAIWYWQVDTSLDKMIINEICANSYESRDWIELYNDGAGEYDLSGFSMTDNPEDPAKFIFPSGTTVASGQYLLVYAEDFQVGNEIILGFGLDGDGDGIYLYDLQTELVDSVEFGSQSQEFTIGRTGPEQTCTLTVPTPMSRNISQRTGNSLEVKINEWLADGKYLYNDDFVELYNPGSLPVDISGFYLTDNPVNQPKLYKVRPLSFIDGFGFTVFQADGSAGGGHANFRLSSEMEIIALSDDNGAEIDKVLYMPQTSDISQGRGPDGGKEYRFFEVPSPGSINEETVVINEVLAHSHAFAPDWIELYNQSDQQIDISGWFLSDDRGELRKYEIPENTVIGVNGYIVFYEDQSFNDPNAPGCHIPFALSEAGETLYLYSAENGVFTGYMTKQKFGASQSNVSFGRYRISSGQYVFTAMADNTDLSPNVNSGPKVGPVVISEIMYNPGPMDDDSKLEYIELLNISDNDVIFTAEVGTQTGPDPVNDHIVENIPWQMTNGIEFEFQDNGSDIILQAGERLLLVRDLAAFNSRYPSIPSGVQKFQWTSGGLNNSGERLTLAMPGDKEWQEERYYITVDSVNYSDGGSWPKEADGNGLSLHKIAAEGYSDDPINWNSSSPSPGLP